MLPVSRFPCVIHSFGKTIIALRAIAEHRGAGATLGGSLSNRQRFCNWRSVPDRRHGGRAVTVGDIPPGIKVSGVAGAGFDHATVVVGRAAVAGAEGAQELTEGADACFHRFFSSLPRIGRTAAKRYPEWVRAYKQLTPGEVPGVNLVRGYRLRGRLLLPPPARNGHRAIPQHQVAAGLVVGRIARANTDHALVIALIATGHATEWIQQNTQSLHWNSSFIFTS